MATQPNMTMTMAPAPAPSPLAKAADFDFQKEAGPMAGAAGWSPSENAMASNQLSKLLASDSKLMTQARSMAARSSARRGLLNSSIGVEAGESAAIQSAVPIAQQDAGTFAKAEEFSANAQNQFAMDANRYGRESALTKYQGILAREAQERDFGFRTSERLGSESFTTSERLSTQQYQAGEAALNRAFTSGERIASQDFAAAQAVLDRDFNMRVKQLEEGGMDRRQARQIAASEREATANRIFTAEQSALDRQLTRDENAANRSWQTSERVAGQEFTAGEAALQRAWQTGERVSQNDFAAAQSQLDRDQQTRIQELQDQGMDRRQAVGIAAQERSDAAQRVFTAEQAAADRQHSFNMQKDAQVFTRDQAELGRAFEGEMRKLDRDQQTALQNNSQQWQTAMREADQKFQMDFERFRLPMNMMASFSDRMQGFVTQVMSDPNMTPEARNGAIQNYYNYSQQTMGWMAGFFGQSMPNMATGGTITPPTTTAPAPTTTAPAPTTGAPNVSTPGVAGGGTTSVFTADGNWDER